MTMPKGEGPLKIQAVEEPVVQRRRRVSPKRLVALGLVLIGSGAIAAFGVRTFSFYAHHAETDDAQLESHIDPVLPRVAGYVSEVLVDDNQKVAAGQVLLKIDPRDLQTRVREAEAALQSASADVAVAKADLLVARAHRVKAASDLDRYRELRQKKVVSQQGLEAAQTGADAAEATEEAAARQVAAKEAEIAKKKADLDYTSLQLSYAVVTAPAAGIVSRKNVEVGQFVQAGQPLLAIVSGDDLWVVANFKETQLTSMRPGQTARFTVDAYPGVTFKGKVDSIAAATGARFALLPPDNATGNFTKVVQRVPVKIVLTQPPDPQHPLRAGMSVDAGVDLR